jgi:hypothetical protein
MSATVEQTVHKLNDSWTLWAHLPHDVDWSVQSYQLIDTVDTVEGVIALMETLPDKLINNCMLFFMRKNIMPQWEHPLNRNGGCFSYKVGEKAAVGAWRELAYALTGESLSINSGLLRTINGITISPKKKFCISKIWLSSCTYQDPTEIVDLHGIDPYGCLFKKHSPQD